MLKLRKEAFGAVLSDSVTGNIVQLNTSAAAIVERYLHDRDSLSPTEHVFLQSPVFESMFFDKNSEYRIIIPKVQPWSFLSAPESINVRLTHRCNMTCEGCYENRSINHTEDMSSDLLSKVINYADAYGVSRIQFGGGEPFLYDNLFNAIREASQKGIFVSIGTNGLLLSEKVIKKCKEYGCGHIQLSFTNPVFFKKNEVDTFTNTTKILTDSGIKFGFNIILTKSIINDIFAVVDKLQQLQPHNINILRPKPAPTNKKWYETEKLDDISEELKVLLYKLQTLHKNIHLDCSLAKYRTEKNIGCLAASRSMTILPDGSILPCPFLSDFCIRNNSHYKDLNEMWLYSSEINYYRLLLKGSPECNQSPLYTLQKCMLFPIEK